MKYIILNSFVNSTHLSPSGGSNEWALVQANENVRIPFSLSLLLIALFVIAPLSISTVPYVVTMKYARFGLLALVVMITLQRLPRIGKLSRAWLLLGTVYAVSSVWSSLVVTAFAYKSMFLAMILGGICLGNTAVSLSGVISCARAVTSAGVIMYLGTALAILQGIAEPIYWFNDRMSVLGLNSNFVGVFSTSYFVAAVAVFLFTPSRSWKYIGFCAAGMFAMGVIYSGSRLAILMSIVTTFLFFFAKLEKHRQKLLYASALMIFVISVAFLLSPQSGASSNNVAYEASSEGGSGFRFLDELTRDTRSGHWARAIGIWKENPILGVGWSEFRGRWELHHSAYLQVLVESGIFGALAWAWVLWCCFTQCKFVYVNRRFLSGLEVTTAELGMAALGGCLIHAFGESALLAATMPLAVALGVAIQHLDEAASNIAQIQSDYSGLEYEASDEPRWDDAEVDQFD